MKKFVSIFGCYETNCGGETVATENIIHAFFHDSRVHIDYRFCRPLEKTALLKYGAWIFHSIVFWTNKIFQRRSVDWVYTTTYTAGVAAALLKPFFHFQIAWHFHGSRIPPSPIGLRGKTYITQAIKYHVVRYLHVFFLSRTDHVCVPSTEGKQWITTTFPWFDYSKISIIPNGVDHKKFYPLSQRKRFNLRKKHHIATDTHVLLSVGRLDKQKGIETLLAVTNELQKIDPPIRVFCVHPRCMRDEERIYRKELIASINLLQLKNKVMLVEDPPHIEEYYYIADLTSCFSRLEFFPLTMMESFACKTLFVGFHAGNIGRFLKEIDTRLLLKQTTIPSLSTQMSRLLSLSHQEKQSIAQRGYEKSLLYSWKHTALLISGVFNGK